MAIHVGLVGYGMSGSVFHAPLIGSTPGLVLTTVVSSQPQKVLHDLPEVTVVPTLAELLALSEIELVVIATPNDSHYELAKQALLAGKHVVVDKPFVVHTVQADELINLAHTQRVCLSVFQNRRWDNDFLTVQQLLHSGLLGELTSYESHFDRYRPLVRARWRDQAQPGAGVLYDLGSHLIDQALLLFGLPHTLWADLRSQRADAQVDDYVHLVLSYPHMRVILHATLLAREPGPRFLLHGSAGSFSKYGLDPQEDALKAGKRPGSAGWGLDRVEDYGSMVTSVDELSMAAKITTLAGSYETFYQGIVAAITLGHPLPVTARHARNTIKIIEDAMRSHKEQKTIVI